MAASRRVPGGLCAAGSARPCPAKTPCGRDAASSGTGPRLAPPPTERMLSVGRAGPARAACPMCGRVNRTCPSSCRRGLAPWGEAAGCSAAVNLRGSRGERRHGLRSQGTADHRGRSGSTEAQTVQRRPVSPCRGTGFCRRGQLRVLRPHVAALGPDCPWSSPAAGGACAPAGFAHSCAEGRAALAPATGHFAQRPGVSRARGFPRGLPDSADPRFRPSQGGVWGPGCPGVGVPWRWTRGMSLRPLRRPRLRGTGSRVVRGAVIQRPLLAAGLSRARTLIRGAWIQVQSHALPGQPVHHL